MSLMSAAVVTSRRRTYARRDTNAIRLLAAAAAIGPTAIRLAASETGHAMSEQKMAGMAITRIILRLRRRARAVNDCRISESDGVMMRSCEGCLGRKGDDQRA